MVSMGTTPYRKNVDFQDCAKSSMQEYTVLNRLVDYFIQIKSAFLNTL
jgi:hypothetical protein